jgi:hypothetical protein
MYPRRLQAKGLFFLGGNLGLALLAVWLAAGYYSGPPTFEKDVLPPTSHLKNKDSIDFPLRKVSPPLEEVLKKSEAFASRVDRAQTVVLTKPAISTHQSLATPVSFAPKAPSFAWDDLRLAGVALARGNGRDPGIRYAVFEFHKTQKQTLLKEGETLDEGVRVVKVELEQVVVEAGGEVKVLEVSLVLPKVNQPRRRRSPWVASRPYRKRLEEK